MNEFNGIIYKAENITNNHVYIGQTIYSLENRKIRHKHDAFKKNINHFFYHAIRKYGWDNFGWKILARAYSREELNNLEKFYISEYRKITKCYNSTDGGEGMSGFCLSEKAKEKISKANKGKCAGNKNPMYGRSMVPWNKGKTNIYSEETKIKLREAILRRGSPMKGKKFPETSKIIISDKLKAKKKWIGEKNPNFNGKLTSGENNGMYGKKHSEESKRKMSIALQGRIPWNKKINSGANYD